MEDFSKTSMSDTLKDFIATFLQRIDPSEKQSRNAEAVYLLNCSTNPLLADFNRTINTGKCTILNVDLNENHWLQASPLIADGGQRIRSDQC